MKITFTTIIFFLSIYFCQATNFGPDVTVNPDTTYDMFKPCISVSFNGWVYAGYNFQRDVFSGFDISVSKDNGLTWHNLVHEEVPGASAFYPRINDMVVTGSDTNNLHVIVAIKGNGAAGPQASGVLTVYDGLNGIAIGNPVGIGDAFAFGVRDIALCSDYKHPLAGGSPYRVMAVYSQYGNSSGTDSILYYMSEDGGMNFTGPYPVATTTNDDFGNIDVAYGSYHQSPNIVGRFSIVWEQNGHIGASQCDVGLPINFSYSILLDTAYSNLNGRCYNPKIAIMSAEYKNSSTDYSTAVVAERYDSVTASNDIIGFFNSDTQNGGFGYADIIDSSSDNTLMPYVFFDELRSNFIVTWYNSTTKKLPCLYHAIDFYPGTGAWITMIDNYADTLMFDTPYPVMDANSFYDDVSVLWIQESDTANLPGSYGILKYDASNLPNGLQTIHGIEKRLIIYPNPSDGNFTLRNTNNNLINKIEIIDSMGEIVYYDVLKQPELHLSLSNGIYSVRLFSESGIQTSRLIVAGE